MKSKRHFRHERVTLYKHRMMVPKKYHYQKKEIYNRERTIFPFVVSFKGLDFRVKLGYLNFKRTVITVYTDLLKARSFWVNYDSILLRTFLIIRVYSKFVHNL